MATQIDSSKVGAEEVPAETEKATKGGKGAEEAEDAVYAQETKGGKGAEEAEDAEKPKLESKKVVTKMVTLANPEQEIFIGNVLAEQLVTNPAFAREVAQSFGGEMYELRLSGAQKGGYKVKWEKVQRGYLMDQFNNLWQSEVQNTSTSSSTGPPERPERSRSRSPTAESSQESER